MAKKPLLRKTLERYKMYSVAESALRKSDGPENHQKNGLRTVEELLKMTNESTIENLSTKELIRLESDFNAKLDATRQRKSQLFMEHLAQLKNKDKQLKEENRLLQIQIETMINDGQGGYRLNG